MVINRSVRKMRALAQRLRSAGKSVGFVPTMGALHEGHLSLIRRARRENDAVVVSIFVNPTQFGPKEDFAAYPRRLQRDAALCRKEGVDALFYPSAAQMYPAGYATYVQAKGLEDLLCGKFRPGHFRGVLTVVAKLFNIVMPSAAYFGQKDAQQVFLVRKMVQDLDFPLEVKVVPTMREGDGLAMSSRNAYLSPAQRAQAAAVYRALRLARETARQGTRDARTIIRAMAALIREHKLVRIQYLAIVDASTFSEVRRLEGRCLALAAVWLGNTRLIDNMEIRT